MKYFGIKIILLGLALLVALPAWAGAHSYRSPVSRARTDMRSLATAIETYYVDFNAYPAPLPDDKMAPDALDPYITMLFPDPHKDRLYRRTDYYIVFFFDRPWTRWTFLGTLLLGILHTLWALRDEAYRAELCGFRWAVVLLVIFAGPKVLQQLLDPTGNTPLFGHYSYAKPNNHWTDDYTSYNYYSDRKNGWVLQGVGPNGIRDLDDLSRLPMHDMEEAQRQAIPYTYDPTNGILSAGDLFRFHQ